MTDEEIVGKVREKMVEICSEKDIVINDALCLEIGCRVLMRGLKSMDACHKDLTERDAMMELYKIRFVPASTWCGPAGWAEKYDPLALKAFRIDLSPNMNSLEVGYIIKGFSREGYGIPTDTYERFSGKHPYSYSLVMDWNMAVSGEIKIELSGTATQIYSNLRILHHERGAFLTRK